jgi:hypothetical protein
MSGSVPARIVPPERALPPLRLLRTVVDNPIKAWPRAIYRERTVRSRVLGRDTVYVMAPDLIRVRPSILAVWALMTNSNLVDCTTGKSAGFAPLRMRPA